MPSGENQQNTVENFSLHFSPSFANHDRIFSGVPRRRANLAKWDATIKSELHNLDPAALGNYVTRFGLVVIGLSPPGEQSEGWHLTNTNKKFAAPACISFNC